MKKIIKLFLVYVLLMTTAFCSSNKEDNTNSFDSEIPATPATGKVFNSSFSFLEGYAHNLNESGVDKLVIYLSAQNLNCSNSTANAFPIYISTPKTIGVNKTNTFIVFKKLTSSDYVSVTSGVEVIIDSMTSTTVIGRVKGSDLNGENTILGKFEVPICF